MSRFARFLLASTVLHGLAVLFLMSHFFRPWKGAPSSALPLPMEIEITEIAKIPRPGDHGGPHAKGLKHPDPLALSDLGLRARLRKDLKSSTKEEQEDPSKAKPDSPARILHGHSKNFAALKYFYDRIGAILTYPDEFRRSGYQGVVSGALYIEKNGDIRWNKDDFVSSNRFLRVHALRTLRRLQKETIPDTYLRSLFADGAKRIEVFLNFDFSFSENENPAVLGSKNYVAENSFFFFRHHYRSKLQWELGPFEGIFPVPSVGFNPLWIYEKVHAALSKKPKLDPLARYKEDPDF